MFDAIFKKSFFLKTGFLILFFQTLSFGNISKQDSSLNISVKNSFTFVGVFIPHNQLRRVESRMLRKWPFFAMASPMGFVSNITIQKNINKLFSVKSNTNARITLIDIGLKTGLHFSALHLLELGVEGEISSGMYYWKNQTTMGVYDPEEKDFSTDILFTEFYYSINYLAGLSIPLMAFLPKSNWTKIILRPTASLKYNAYTGANDGEIFIAGQSGAMANGFKYKYGISFMYMLPLKHFPMFMLMTDFSGALHEGNYDAIYKDYNPTFRTFFLTPMLSFKINESWGGMFMASFSSNREFENFYYKNKERYLQKYKKAVFEFNAFMVMLTKNF